MRNIKLVTGNLREQLTGLLNEASSIYILTSFIMKSGVSLLAPFLKKAVNRGAEVKICTGDYLFVTQPEALERLIEIDSRIEIQLYRSNGRSFHPKAYLFQNTDGDGSFIVGSSNLSNSALTSGVEWSLIINNEVAQEVYLEALDAFSKTFHHEQTITINQETLKDYRTEYEKYHERHPNLLLQWTKSEEEVLTLPTVSGQPEIIREPPVLYRQLTPRPAQQEALEMLSTTLEEGYSKAMVVMATGLGKTYLAGFFARKFKRILFIAHREEILGQAKNSFRNIMPERSMGLYYGRDKEGDADCVFASIYSLGINRHLARFEPGEFDLIIVDEFHHAAAGSYQKVIDFFKPKFLLGITATPDRMDGKDVYAICDGNVAYQLHFIEAIEKKWLAPFHYYGIYDDTDFSQITWLGTRYDEEELALVQLRDDMADKVLKAWKSYKQSRTIAFCSSIRQANFLSEYFNRQGYQTVSLNSKTVGITRGEAIKRLDEGALDMIFTVDLFNEGVDIPSVDTLLFVRPTESLTVFTQQVGRGLRLFAGKDHCVIIDLIGNYRNADIKLQLFNTEPGKEKNGKKASIPAVPPGCELNIELAAVNLLNELNRKRQPKKDKLFWDYIELKKELGRRPTYLELHLHGRSNSREYRQEFKSYPGFLYWADELTEKEKNAFLENETWLVEVESTGMAKSYKMVVLNFMLSKGLDNWLVPVTPNEVAPYFHRYMTEKEYRKRIDFSDKASKQLWQYDEQKVSKLIANMPMTKWSGSSKGLTAFNQGVFSIKIQLPINHNEIVFEWTRQICEYRLHEHFERKDENLKLLVH
ncbi:DEAD/DEAH box helicase family protein [Fictibacillus terranigra]|uniref:DEAD/DEAH box helicase family protein n=1 Tax=Fictibacillus terranigra TaxID=3058424 RepID=A0ABT8E877_9BACL|nr:DEAD/DEAH box helicase family protein [Fictibacillus sp. CENA-BCM004]MDN4074110.1 DEAD/DEAH box helicase family protein [Fictibacillus sp. CENA-BCM004]